MMIAVLGPANTYSDLVLKKARPKAKPLYAVSVDEVFDWVEKGKVREGLVPLENSLTGSVRETLDELYARPVFIDEIVAQSIHLVLAGLKKIPLASVRTIYSHPQALLQSRQFIRKHCPKAMVISVESTATALHRVINENSPTTVAVASLPAAKANRLTVLKDSIEDNHSNTTWFAMIKKGVSQGEKGKKTSIAFTFDKDSPGSLYSVFGDFAHAKINLTRIESRPNPAVAGDYVFYLDFEGGVNSSTVKKTLKAVKEKVAHLKLLGCY